MAARLAGRPPLSSLIGLVFRAGVIVGASWLTVRWIHAMRTRPYDQVATAFVVMAGLLGLYCLIGLMQGVRRWTAGAGVWIDGDTLRVRAPGVTSAWNPWPRLHDHRVALSEVRTIDFRWGDKVRTVFELGDAKVEIPSGTFAVGAHDLDAAIRARAPHLEPAPPRHTWAASPWMRLLMIPLGLAFLIGGTVFAAWVTHGGGQAPRIVLAPMLMGIGCFILPFVYRGKVVIDRRGIFHQDGGRLSFVPWELVQQSKVVVAMQFPGWTTMAIKQRGQSWVHLTRLLGVGFPIRRIAEALARGPE